MVQIETMPALARLPEIAAVPGIDAIFIGPADLSASMGHLGDIGHADVQATLRDAARQCKALGKPVGIIGANPDLVAKYVEYGYNWIAIGSDMGFMQSRGQEWLAKAARTRASGPPSPARIDPSFRCVLDVQRQARRVPGVVGARQGAVLGRHRRAVAQPLRPGDRLRTASRRCPSRSAALPCASPTGSSSRCAAASGSLARTVRSIAASSRHPTIPRTIASTTAGAIRRAGSSSAT